MQDNEKWFWMSCKDFTAGVVTTKDGYVIRCAPIIAKFTGQKIERLKAWMEKKFGKIEVEEIE